MRVGPKDVEQINILYKKHGTYAEVARQTGFSPATVKKYVKKDFTLPIDKNEIKRFETTDFPKTFSNEMFIGIDNYGDLCVLSDDEKVEIQELWKELTI